MTKSNSAGTELSKPQIGVSHESPIESNHMPPRQREAEGENNDSPVSLQGQSADGKNIAVSEKGKVLPTPIPKNSALLKELAMRPKEGGGGAGGGPSGVVE